jgi:hypothetical protein
MCVIIFQIMEYDGNQNSVPDLLVAIVTQSIDEFFSAMFEMSDFFVTVDESFVTSRTTLGPIETFLFFCCQR